MVAHSIVGGRVEREAENADMSLVQRPGKPLRSTQGALKRGKCGPFIPIGAIRFASIFQFVIVLTRDIQAWLIDLARLPAALTHQNERNHRVVWMQGV